MKTDPTANQVLLVVRQAANLCAEDRAVQRRLERLGYAVTAEEDTRARPASYSLVVLSSVVGRPNLATEFRTADVPIVVMGENLYADLGMTGCNYGADGKATSHYGRKPGQTELMILNSWHSMAAGLERKVKVTTHPAPMTWGRPKNTAVKVATLVSAHTGSGGGAGEHHAADKEYPVIFGYESGAEMFDLVARARRVGLFFDKEMVLGLNNSGWTLFDAAIKWAVGEELKQFAEVFQEEWQEITERRYRQRIEANPAASAQGAGAERKGDNSHNGTNGTKSAVKKPGQTDPALKHDASYAPQNLTGLALSGGGIRSATFCLGLLQGLEQHNVLRVFDYLSTVSGGGYLGGWWSAWLARKGLDEQVRSAYPLLGVNDIKCPHRLSRQLLNKKNPISSYLCQKLFATQGTKELVERLSDNPAPGDDDTKALVNELNKLLPPPCLYIQEIFSRITLTPEMEGLLKQVREGANGNTARRLNRLLLEHAYPELISASIFPPDEQIEPVRSQHFSLLETQAIAQYMWRDGKTSDSATEMRCAGHDPTHHLRLFANYLTPRKGMLSSDTWRAIAVISRNLFLNWITLLPLLVTFMLLGQLFFVLRPAMPLQDAVPPLKEQMAAFGLTARDTDELYWNTKERVEWDELLDEYKHDFVFPYWREVARHNEQTETLNARIARKNRESVKSVEEIGKLEEELKKSGAKAESLSTAHNESLRQRIIYAATLCGLIYALVFFMSAVWMIRNTSGSNLLGWFGGIAFWLLIGILVVGFLRHEDLGKLLHYVNNPATMWEHCKWYIGGGGAWLLLGLALWVWAWKGGGKTDAATVGQDEESRRQWRREVQRNRTTRVHSRLLILFVLLTGVLTLAGFGYEIFNFVLYSQSKWIAHAGGGLTLLTAIVGAIYTAIKTSPVGGGDDNLEKKNKPSLPSRIIFAFTPPLVLIVLAVAASTLAHTILSRIVSSPVVNHRVLALTIATFVTLILCLTFSVAEVRWRKGLPKVLIAATSAVSIGAGILTYWLTSGNGTLQPLWLITVATLSGCLILVRLSVDEARCVDDTQHRTFRLLVLKSFWRKPITPRTLMAASATAFILCALVWTVLAWRLPQVWKLLFDSQSLSTRAELVGFTTVGLVFCLLFYVLGIWRGTGSNRRSLWLLSAVHALLCVLLVFCFFPTYEGHETALMAHTVVGLISVALGIVIALGWLADPNSLSMHTFYKDRLVRAYLGASNHMRGWGAKDITESVEGDDVLLSQLRNCQRGAPYHLVNSTLNLVAGRDLATVQRSSAMFVLSKRSCGSSRTGYRQTAKYMGGRLSLGTAIAVSGAAASPNMGAHTLSASLAMLMTMLNVRLGYWAPTPYKQHWQLRQAQLWPFYTLRELVSQTNDLSSYCYLTDGGHFDNTGLYSLVERGCRYIVVADCAADAKPCFADLGDAIRRCRIDFGADICLDIDAFIKNSEGRASAHYAVGHITYNPQHVERLNWNPELRRNPENRKGIIILVKPALTNDETVDVRQYSLENDKFPQQTTGDQWFDEAQFESYRHLGKLCADTVFGNLTSIKELTRKRTASGRPAANNPVSIKQVEAIFDEAFAASSGRKTASETSVQLEERFWKVLFAALQADRRQRAPECDRLLKLVISRGVSVLDHMEYLPQHIEAAERNLSVLARLTKEYADKDGRFMLLPCDVAAALATSRLFPFEPVTTTTTS